MANSSSVFRILVFLGVGIGCFFLGRATSEPKLSSAPAPSFPDHRLSAAANASSPAAAAGAERAPAEVAAWREQLLHRPSSEARDEEMMRMVAAWAQVDPNAAREFVQKNFTHDLQAQGLTTVFTSWAKKDPAGAWNWVLTNVPTQTQHLRTVLAEIGRDNLPLAEQFAAAFAQQHPDQAPDVYFSVLDGVMHNGNYQEAVAVVEKANTRDAEQKAMLINFLAGQWARYQPDKAAPWVLSLPPGPVRDQALDAVGQAWSDRDPFAAANFAVTLPPGPTRQTALKQAISKWTLDDPAQASRWVLQFDAHQDFDQAVASIATSNGLMYQNLNLALNWAGSIMDDNLRAQTTTAIVSNWYANDPTAAANYIRTSPDLSPSTRAALLKILPAQNGTAPNP